jgi:hypothetical protein
MGAAGAEGGPGLDNVAPRCEIGEQGPLDCEGRPGKPGQRGPPGWPFDPMCPSKG